jgi:hypothetical protein
VHRTYLVTPSPGPNSGDGHTKYISFSSSVILSENPRNNRAPRVSIFHANPPCKGLKSPWNIEILLTLWRCFRTFERGSSRCTVWARYTRAYHLILQSESQNQDREQSTLEAQEKVNSSTCIIHERSNQASVVSDENLMSVAIYHESCIAQYIQTPGSLNALYRVKASAKRNVFSSRLNFNMSPQFPTLTGSLFHNCGAPTENALPPMDRHGSRFEPQTNLEHFSTKTINI